LSLLLLLQQFKLISLKLNKTTRY